MHPFYGVTPLLHQPPAERLEIDERASLNALRTQSQNSQASIDVFGWAPDMLACIVTAAALRPGVPSPLETFARLKNILSVADIPEAVAFIFTMGNLTMLNKVDPGENEEALRRGETPKYRPINAGSLLLKQALKDATKTASGKRAKALVAPIQLGLGVKAGPERLAWLAHSPSN
jgi:hypothetical protein